MTLETCESKQILEFRSLLTRNLIGVYMHVHHEHSLSNFNLGSLQSRHQPVRRCLVAVVSESCEMFEPESLSMWSSRDCCGVKIRWISVRQWSWKIEVIVIICNWSSGTSGACRLQICQTQKYQEAKYVKIWTFVSGRTFIMIGRKRKTTPP